LRHAAASQYSGSLATILVYMAGFLLDISDREAILIGCENI
jgi:hypothetical protein